MAFARPYSLHEVKGMLQIFEGNLAIQTVNPLHRVQRANEPAHAITRHGGADMHFQGNRVNTPGEARTTGTYWNRDDQAAATMEILNSPTGQQELRKIDLGTQTFASIRANLPPNRYRISVATDRSNTGQGNAGHLNRNDVGRTNAGALHVTTYATTGFVKAVKGVGGLLQIQTSFPET